MMTLWTLMTLALAGTPNVDLDPVADEEQTIDILQSLDRELDKGDAAVVLDDGGAWVTLGEPVTFKTNTAKLDPGHSRTLRKMARTLRRHPDLTVAIMGHADERPVLDGPYEDNEALAEARAEAVRTQLLRRGVEPDQLLAVSLADDDPRAVNAPVARDLNRRVEVRVVPWLDTDAITFDDDGWTLVVDEEGDAL